MEGCHPELSPFPSIYDKRLVHFSDLLALVPYLPHHVPRYHQWMSNHEILAQTASEPLSLEKEYEMQISWANDADKRTFILIPRSALHRRLEELYNEAGDKHAIISYQNEYDITSSLIVDRRRDQRDLTTICSFCAKAGPASQITINSSESVNPILYCCIVCESYAALGEIGATVAIGDVNLFLHDYLQEEGVSDDNEDATSSFESTIVATTDEMDGPTTAEVEIMIADNEQRKKGFGTNALQMILQYSVEYLNIQRIIAKISNDNVPSLNTFKKLGFTVYAEVECFDELHLKFKPSSDPNYPYFT